METLDIAPWLALAVGTIALAVAGIGGWRIWRTYRRVRQTRTAAVALIDVHRARLDAAIDLAGRGAGGLADGGEQLASSIADLRSDVDHLRWMLTRVPDARARLRREILDTVLPTDG